MFRAVLSSGPRDQRGCHCLAHCGTEGPCRGAGIGILTMVNKGASGTCWKKATKVIVQPVASYMLQ